MKAKHEGTKTILYRGVRVTESFASKHGTTGRCTTRQGWSFMGTEWAPSVKQAMTSIDYMLENYSRLGPNGRRLVDQFVNTCPVCNGRGQVETPYGDHKLTGPWMTCPSCKLGRQAIAKATK